MSTIGGELGDAREDEFSEVDGELEG